MLENYYETMTRLQNDEKDRADKKEFCFFEIDNDISIFYYLVTKCYTENPENGCKICKGVECDRLCLLSVSDDDDDNRNSDCNGNDNIGGDNGDKNSDDDDDDDDDDKAVYPI